MDSYASSIDQKDTLWFDEANCKGSDTEAFFIESGEKYPPELKPVCRACNVQRDCLTFAVKYGVQGFWAGTTERDRQQLRASQRLNGQFKTR